MFFYLFLFSVKTPKLACITCFFLLCLSVQLSAQKINSAPVISFDIPDSVCFADDVISLKRIDLRERFDREITSFAYMHTSSLMCLKGANRYFPIIEPILKRNGIPADFMYLALIESSFNPRALSSVKAAGIWQLMTATARELGLEVSEEIDERYDVEKATEAACRYFRQAYTKFGDWMLVAASYNCGMGRINTERTAQKTGLFYDLFLNQETSRYVFRLLAAKVFLQDPQHFGFFIKRDQFYQNPDFIVVEVRESVSDWAEWALAKGYSYAQLRNYNLWIRDRKLTNPKGKRYFVRLPKKGSLVSDPAKISIWQENWAID